MANPTVLKRVPTRTVKDAWNFDTLYVGGINILELIRLAGTGTGTGTGTGMSSISMFSELYQANAAGTGYSADDILRRMEMIDASATPSTSTVTWANVTKATAMAAPLSTHLTLFRDPGLTDAQLRATPLSVLFDANAVLPGIGTVADLASSVDGTGSATLIGGVKRVVAHLNTLLSRTPVLGQGLRAASAPVVLSTEQEKILVDTQANTLSSGNSLTSLLSRIPSTLGGTQATPAMYVQMTNAADIAASIAAGTAGSASKPNRIDDYVVLVAGTGYAVGDQLRRISVFTLDPQPMTITVYWYNLTQAKTIAAPVMTSLQDKVKADALKYTTVHYRVIPVSVGVDLAVSDLETTLSGKVLSVHMLQVSGAGQVVGDDAQAWDLPAGATMSLQDRLGSAVGVLAPDIKFRNVSGVLKLGVNYLKLGGTAVPVSTVSYLTDGVSYLTDSAGNRLVTP